MKIIGIYLGTRLILRCYQNGKRIWASGESGGGVDDTPRTRLAAASSSELYADAIVHVINRYYDIQKLKAAPVLTFNAYANLIACIMIRIPEVANSSLSATAYNTLCPVVNADLFSLSESFLLASPKDLEANLLKLYVNSETHGYGNPIVYGIARFQNPLPIALSYTDESLKALHAISCQAQISPAFYIDNEALRKFTITPTKGGVQLSTDASSKASAVTMKIISNIIALHIYANSVAYTRRVIPINSGTTIGIAANGLVGSFLVARNPEGADSNSKSYESSEILKYFDVNPLGGKGQAYDFANGILSKYDVDILTATATSTSMAYGNKPITTPPARAIVRTIVKHRINGAVHIRYPPVLGSNGKLKIRQVYSSNIIDGILSIK